MTNKYENINTNEYFGQIQSKIDNIYSTFKKDLSLPNFEVAYSNPINFRMRAEFSIYVTDDDIKYYMVEKNGKEKKRIFISSFPIASESINKLMPQLSKLINYDEQLKTRIFGIDFLSTLSNEILITLTYHKKLDDSWTTSAYKLLKQLQENNTDLKIKLIGRAYKQKIIINDDFVWETLHVDNKEYYYHQQENSFTQPNAHINEKMLSWVKNNTKDIPGDLLELYCGNGNFSIVLADCFNHVLATEISKTSVNSAQLNIAKNGTKNLKIARLSAEEFTEAMNKVRKFNRLEEQNIDLSSYDFQTILVDPPRSGLDNYTLEMVRKHNNIVYISCNPETLLQNLIALKDSHEIIKLCFFDQFPYTPHLETGVILKKKEN